MLGRNGNSFKVLNAISLIMAYLIMLFPVHSNAVTALIPLKDITDVDQVLLKCISSEYEVMLPIPKRWEVSKATLRFSYYNSAALIKRTSQLELVLNGVPLAQLKLDPLAPQGNAEVALPPLLLGAQYNSFKISVAQHASTECEFPCAPELWTRLAFNEAILEIEYELKDVPLDLSSVEDFLFDPKISPSQNTHLISENRSAEILTVSSIVASGIALRFDYRKNYFTYGEGLQKGVDNVLVGKTPYVNQFLEKYQLSVRDDGPIVQLFHLPDIVESDLVFDKTHALLVVAAPNNAELKVAAETLDILSIPFPQSSQMKVKAFDVPEVSLYSGKQILITDQHYPLKKLNYTSRTFRGLNATPTSISFRVPSDFLIKPNEYVDLSVDFAYGAALRYDSALNIILNGNHVAAIHLDDPKGAIISGYKLKLPTHLFLPGVNEIAFTAVLTPSITENCSFIQSEHLFLTLFDSTTIYVPEMAHRVKLPELSLLFVSGFPYTRWPDGYESDIYLSETDNTTIASMLNLVGLITQKNGYPLFGLDVLTKAPSSHDAELIIIGKVDSVPKKYLDMAPLKLGKNNRVPYPVFESWDKELALAYSNQESEMGDTQGLIMQFQSPDIAARTITLFTSKTLEGLSRLSSAIMEPSVQTKVHGDLILIDYVFNEYLKARFGNGTDYSVMALKAGPSYVTGKAGKISRFDFYLASYPWIYFLALASVLLLIVFCIYFLLKRHHKNRLGDESV